MRITNNSTSSSLQAAEEKSKADKSADSKEGNASQNAPNVDSFSNAGSDMQQLLKNEPGLGLGESFSYNNDSSGIDIEQVGSNIGVYGTESDDVVVLKGDDNYIETRDGIDRITVDGNSVTVESGDGGDWVTVSGSGHTVNAGGGCLCR